MNFRERRKNLGLSRNQIARELMIHPNNLSRLESQKNPRAVNALAIEYVLSKYEGRLMNILEDLKVPEEDRIYGIKNKSVHLEGKTIQRDIYRVERKDGLIIGNVLRAGKWRRVIYDEAAQRWREVF